MVPKMSRVLLCGFFVSAMASTMSIVSKNHPKFCLDLLGQRTQSGTPIDTWECVAGLLGQQWFFDAGSYKIRSAVAPAKCIDAGAGSANTKLTLVDCVENSTGLSGGQYFGWDIKTNAIYATPEKGDIKPSSMCMQISDKNFHGASVMLSPCNATSDTQQWAAVVGPPPAPTKNETFTFSPESNSKTCLDVKDGKALNGNPIDVVACKQGAQSQEWIFTEGSYRIASALNPSKCIDASVMKNGTHLMLWDCNGFPQQQWGYQQSKGGAGGTVYLTQADAVECLSIDAASSMAAVGSCMSWRLTRVPHTIVV